MDPPVDRILQIADRDCNRLRDYAVNAEMIKDDYGKTKVPRQPYHQRLTFQLRIWPNQWSPRSTDEGTYPDIIYHRNVSLRGFAETCFIHQLSFAACKVHFVVGFSSSLFSMG